VSQHLAANSQALDVEARGHGGSQEHKELKEQHKVLPAPGPTAFGDGDGIRHISAARDGGDGAQAT